MLFSWLGLLKPIEMFSALSRLQLQWSSAQQKERLALMQHSCKTGAEAEATRAV